MTAVGQISHVFKDASVCVDSAQSGWCPRSARFTANSEFQSLLKTALSWFSRASAFQTGGGGYWEIARPTPAVVTK